MPKLITEEYNRDVAVGYAHEWALKRNPKFYNFDEIGGDCTSFASQCLYAGTGAMNFTPVYGWFYFNINNRAPAWSSVKYLYNFLLGNKAAGPFGREVGFDEVQKDDLVQLIINQPDFQHTPVITSVGKFPDPNNILVAAHSYDCDDKRLSDYDYKAIRFIHIEGCRRA